MNATQARQLVTAGVAAVLCTFGTTAAAQPADYPSKPIRLVIS